MRRFALILSAMLATGAAAVLQPAQAAPVTIEDPAGDAGLIIEEPVGVPAGAPGTLDILETKVEHDGTFIHVTTKLTEVSDTAPPGATGYMVALEFTLGDVAMRAAAIRDSTDGDSFVLYYPDPTAGSAELACGKCKGKFSSKDATVTMQVPIDAIGAVKRFYPGTPEPGPGKDGLTAVRGSTSWRFNVPGVVSFFPLSDVTEAQDFTF